MGKIFSIYNKKKLLLGPLSVVRGQKCTTYRLFCITSSFVKFVKGVTILLIDPVGSNFSRSNSIKSIFLKLTKHFVIPKVLRIFQKSIQKDTYF